MRNVSLRLFAITLGAAGLWLAHTQQPQPLTVTKVFDDLHVIVGSGGNVAVYETPEGVILVDDKFEPNFPEIIAKVKSITDKPIRYLLNTHQHGDHTGGNAKMLAAGTELVIHEQARANMSERSMPGLPRLTFSERFAINLGGKEVRAQHYGRGHTNGDAFMYFPAHRALHTGDMFVDGGPFIDYSSGGSGVEWTQTIDRVLKLDFETVIPGHGPVLKRADLVSWKERFENLKAELAGIKRSGKSKEEAVKLFDPTKHKLGDATRWQRSFGGLWDEIR